MKVYAISGLGADERVFKFLKTKHQIIPVKWIEPYKNESIEKYSLRLSYSINEKEPYAILGVSFGGLVAIELSKIVNLQKTILVSSVSTRNEMPTLYRVIGKIGLVNVIPSIFFKPYPLISNWLFGAKNKKLLNEIIRDTDAKFAKWCVKQLINWNNTTLIKNCFKIVGEKDRLLPPSDRNNSIVIKNGHHFMIVDKSEKISHEIEEILKL